MPVEGSRRRRGRAALAAGLVGVVAAGVVVGLGATASGATKPPPNLTPQERALFQYAACMRGKGVNIPDPVKQKNGTYAFPKIPDKVLNAPGVKEKARACAAQLPRTGRGPGGQGGSVSGPITSVNGTTFTLKTQQTSTGKSTVAVGSAKVTREIKALRSSLKVGACVLANGTRNSKGVVAADRITISAPVKGKCGGGFTVRNGQRGAGTPPASQGGGGQQPPGAGGLGGNGNFGFAAGTVTKVSGDTITVKSSFGQTNRTTVVTVSSKTALQRTIGANASAIRVGLCAFVQGTSGDKGVTVKATSIALTPETNGTCRFR
jgi:Domain of unknown function (DUF5666)